jgi:branched-chain amino acid transport system permease protein
LTGGTTATRPLGRGAIRRDRVLALLASVVLILVAIAMPHFLGSYYLSLLTQAVIYAIAAVSLDLVWGYTGIPDLGHSLWFSIGTLGVGVMTTKLASSGLLVGVHPGLGRHLLGLGIGVAAAAILAAALGAFAFYQQSAGPLYIAIVTLALALVTQTIYGEEPQWTGGDNGLFGFNYTGVSATTWYFISAAVLLVAIGLSLALVRSDFGLLMRAVRDDERRVRYLGRDVEAVKISIFVLGAALAGVAGGLYGMVFGFVSAPFFGFVFSTEMLVWVAVGGRGTIIGPVIGAIGLSFAESELSASFPTEWTLIVGLLFVAVVVFIPDGVLPPFARLFRRYVLGAGWRHGHRRLVAAREHHAPAAARSRTIATIEDVRFSYGDLHVLRGVDFEVHRGELLCIVGPNGAGKSTLVNVMTDGRLPIEGTVGYDVHGSRFARGRMSADRIARRGVVRKFQVPELFSSLTVAETILLASRVGKVPSIWRRTQDVEVIRPVLDIVAAAGLVDRENELAPALAHGLKQGLELAAVVSMDPELLLLDEPTAGLTSNERHVIGEVLRRMLDRGLTVILIEHDLDFVARVADRVVVLHGGQVAAMGTPAEVAASDVVRQAYVGVQAG